MTHEERINWVRFNLTGKLKREFDEVLQEEREKTIDEVLEVVEWDGYTFDIKERIKKLKGKEE